MDTKKIIAGILGGATLVGGTYAITVNDISNLEIEVAKIQNEKNIILKDNIWKSARLNEVPEWDISIISAEEMTKAYAEKVNETNATTSPNLFIGLQNETIKRGVNCIK